MNRLSCLLIVSSLLVMAIHGCNDLALPAGSLGEVEVLEEPILEMLEADRVYPAEQEIGKEFTVFGQGMEFPSGFYKVTFSGGVSYEFFQAKATGNLTLELPVGARSGPFGFTVGSRPSSGPVVGAPSTDGFASYSVKDPGIRVIGTDPWIPR